MPVTIHSDVSCGVLVSDRENSQTQLGKDLQNSWKSCIQANQEFVKENLVSWGTWAYLCNSCLKRSWFFNISSSRLRETVSENIHDLQKCDEIFLCEQMGKFNFSPFLNPPSFSGRILSSKVLSIIGTSSAQALFSCNRTPLETLVILLRDWVKCPIWQ